MPCVYSLTADTLTNELFSHFFSFSAAAYSAYFYLFRDPQPQCFYSGTLTWSAISEYFYCIFFCLCVCQVIAVFWHICLHIHRPVCCLFVHANSRAVMSISLWNFLKCIIIAKLAPELLAPVRVHVFMGRSQEYTMENTTPYYCFWKVPHHVNRNALTLWFSISFCLSAAELTDPSAVGHSQMKVISIF